MTPTAITYLDDAAAVLALEARPRPKIAEIQIVVCRYYNLELIDMASQRRARDISRPRQIAMYLARQLTIRSLPEIGRLFGGRDHSTVIHAIRAVRALMEVDSSFAAEVADVCVALAALVDIRVLAFRSAPEQMVSVA